MRTLWLVPYAVWLILWGAWEWAHGRTHVTDAEQLRRERSELTNQEWTDGT